MATTHQNRSGPDLLYFLAFQTNEQALLNRLPFGMSGTHQFDC